MRHDYNTEQFQAFRQEVRESFWGQVRWRTQHALEQMLDADSEQQMAEYLGLARYERMEEPEERVDSRNGFYERDYVTPLGAIRLGAADPQAFVPAAGDRDPAAARAGNRRADPANLSTGDFHACRRPRGGAINRRAGQCADRLATDPVRTGHMGNRTYRLDG